MDWFFSNAKMFNIKSSEIKKMKWPLLATPKKDGIRAFTFSNQALTKTSKPIPNLHISSMLNSLPQCLDGEIIAGDYNQTRMAVMTSAGKPDFTFYIFDYFLMPEIYIERMAILNELRLPSWCKVLSPILINNVKEFRIFEKQCLKEKNEGVILREANGLSSAGGYKVKKFKDAEAEVIGIKRGKKAVIVQGINGEFEGKVFSLAMSGSEAKITDIITYMYQPHGSMAAPRFASVKGIRERIDL